MTPEKNVDEHESRESVSSILEKLGRIPTMAKSLSAAGKVNRLLDAAPLIRYSVVRNVTLEPGLPAAMKIAAARRGLRAKVHLGDFDAAAQDVFDISSSLYASEPEIVVIALRLHTLAPRLMSGFAALKTEEIEHLVDSTLQRMNGLVRAIRDRSNAIILVHNFELPMIPTFGILDAQLQHGQRRVIGGLNSELARLIAAVNSAYIVDIDNLLSVDGYDASLDDRYWHIGRAPYTFAFIQRLADEYVKFGAALKGKAKKCLVLDCDNTLWGGVIGEDGLNGIALGSTHPGSAFLALQSVILDLYNRGVLLAVNSKNNYADAFAVFETHPASLLRPEHFVAMEINWDDKVTNLRRIAARLNIGLDSLVFVDDNAFECRYVREMLPEVQVVELPPDATSYERLLRSVSGAFDTLTLSDEDRRRSQMYRSEANRSHMRESAESVEDYLASLSMVVTISLATEYSVPRIAQLTQKTNQFNLTTRRYSEEDVRAMIADPAWRVYFAEVEDTFDRAGIIAAVLVRVAATESFIDTFLMSCRVIGRGVERAILAAVARDSRDDGKTVLVGEFIPTAKNEIVSEFYESAGFVPNPGASGRWDLFLEGALPESPRWFREVRFAGELVEA